MSSEQEEPKKISRREFLKGSLFTAGGMALSGMLAGCSPSENAATEAPAPAASEADPILL